MSVMYAPIRRGAHAEQKPTSYWLPFAAIMVFGALLRYWTLARNPGYELDEAVYARVAENLLNGHGMRAEGQLPGELYGGSLYFSHPPFHFYVQAAWMWVFGQGVESARYFAATCSLIAIGLAALAMRRHYGNRASLLGALALTTMSWLIFENRIAWIDNAQMVLVALLITAFYRAQRQLTTEAWATAGALLGAVIIYKHTGAAYVLGIGLALLLIRRHTPDWVRGAATLITSTAVVLLFYLMFMTALFGQSYLGQSFSQFNRSTGEVKSPGTLDLSRAGVTHALGTPYWIFVGTGITVLAAFYLAARRAIRVYRNRDRWNGHELLAALTIGTMGSLLILQLRFPHYFMMAFFPAAMYVAAESAHALRQVDRRRLVGMAIIALTITNVIGGGLRLAWHPDNTIQHAAAYLVANSTRDDVLVGDESLGNLTGIRYCMSSKPRCAASATWIEAYTSYTQKRPDNGPFKDALRRATKCVSWQGFREVVSIYAVAPRTCPGGEQ